MKKWVLAASLCLVISLLAASCGQSAGGGDLLGDEYVSQDGSYKLRKPFGYAFQQDGDVANFLAPDGDPEIGPMLMAVSGETGVELDNDALFEQTAASLSVMEFSRPKKVTINGVKGLLASGEAEYGEQMVEGQLFVAMLTPTRQFSFIGFAPKERAKELVKIFDAVLDSASFTAAAEGGMGAEQGAESVSSAAPQPLRQWASSAYASSEYSSTDYSASRATGAPDVDNCGDNVNAWASREPDTEEWLELTYDVPVVASEINIYQSFNPSQVVEVQIVDTNGESYAIWGGPPESVENCPDLMTITVVLDEEIYVKQVVVFVDQSVMGWGWSEIDAVELVGFPAGMPQPSGDPGQPTAQSESASSSGGSGEFSPEGLASGAFVYRVSGYESDLIENNSVYYNSTDVGYVVAMASGGTGRYAVNFILPKQGMKNGMLDLVPYDDKDAVKFYMGMIYINAFPYKASEGWIDIQSDPKSGLLTGAFSFKAQSSDFPDRWVTVEGAMKDIPLK